MYDMKFVPNMTSVCTVCGGGMTEGGVDAGPAADVCAACARQIADLMKPGKKSRVPGDGLLRVPERREVVA